MIGYSIYKTISEYDQTQKSWSHEQVNKSTNQQQQHAKNNNIFFRCCMFGPHTKMFCKTIFDFRN